MAEVYGEVTARCQGNRVVVAPGAQTSCTSTYKGVEIPWSVSMDSDVVPDPLYINFYTIEPRAELLTVERVHVALRRFHSSESDQFRCDAMPPVFRVDRPTTGGRATDTGYRCQYLAWPRDNVRTWVDVSLKVGHEGNVIYAEE